MLTSIFNYFDLSLLFGGLVALGSGLVVIMSDSKKLEHKAWLMVNLSSAVWSFGYLSMTISSSHEMALISNWILHYAAILVPIFYFLFILTLTDTLNKNGWALAIFAPIGIYFLGINHTVLFVRDVFPKFIFNFVCDAGPAYIYFTIYFFAIILAAWYVLYQKILVSKPDEATRLKFMLWGSIAGFAGGGSVFFITFNVNFPPYPMVLFSFYPVIISYAILKYKLFNIKVVSTELFVFSMWIFILFRTLLATTLADQVANSVLLLSTIIVGMFLIKAVIREVEQREKIQKLAGDLANTNKELESANDKLKELDKQKTEFVSLASHQLRSPLTAIKGYSSMILEGDYGKITGKMKEAVGRVFESSQKLVLVIEDFLNITRIELGRIKYDMTEWSFNTLIKNVIGEQKPNIERRGLAISYEEDAPEYTVYADQGKVSQVISNLIDNSVKYTKQGSLKVKVTGVTNSDGKKAVRFTVTDTGVGIDPKTMPHLFQKFSRADDASKTNIIGTGLGLYVAKQIMDAHQGKIWAESEGKDKGSTFFVELALTTGIAPIPVIPPAEIESNPTVIGTPKPVAEAAPAPVSPTPASSLSSGVEKPAVSDATQPESPQPAPVLPVPDPLQPSVTPVPTPKATAPAELPIPQPNDRHTT